jgi:hypothetical protein
MLSRVRAAGCVWSLLAVAVSAGCATQRDAVTPVAMEGGSLSSEVASLEGVWEGQVWEMPVHYVQGVRSVTLKIGRDGTWTATTGGAQCASGTASIRGGLVILGGTRTGPDYCMPYSLASKDGRMKAVFETSFKAREGSAMIGLQRVPERLPEAAQAPRP